MKKDIAFELGFRVGVLKAAAETSTDVPPMWQSVLGPAIPGAVGGMGAAAALKGLKNLFTGDSGGYAPWLLGGGLAGAGLGGSFGAYVNKKLQEMPPEERQKLMSRARNFNAADLLKKHWFEGPSIDKARTSLKTEGFTPSGIIHAYDAFNGDM